MWVYQSVTGTVSRIQSMYMYMYMYTRYCRFTFRLQLQYYKYMNNAWKRSVSQVELIRTHTYMHTSSFVCVWVCFYVRLFQIEESSGCNLYLQSIIDNISQSGTSVEQASWKVFSNEQTTAVHISPSLEIESIWWYCLNISVAESSGWHLVIQ